MRKLTKITAEKATMPLRKKVAAYARISMETERLHHSLSAQVSHYNTLIQANPEWIFAGIYADEGVTGTSAEKRAEFQRMMVDCEEGKIDIVLTKSISRFARNTVDLLNTVRRLKELGIEVRFEKEGISSLDGTGEVMLTLLASFAQEEITSLSNNVKWGIRKRFEAGDPCTHFRIYGYRWKDDSLVVQPDEAAVVKRIFQNFLDGKSRLETEREFSAEGITTAKGFRWIDSNIKLVLTNITYTGSLLLQKEFIIDPISKKKRKNRGELPQYYVEGTHEAIINMETFAFVQQEMARRKELGPLANKSLNTSCFTGKIKCGHCGMSYMHSQRRNKAKTVSSYDGYRYVQWVCGTRKKKGSKCRMRSIPEVVLKQICAEALGLESFSEKSFTERVDSVIVIENGMLEFRFRDGSAIQKRWKSTAKRDCWTEEYKNQQRQWVKRYMAQGKGRFYPFTTRMLSEYGIAFRHCIQTGISYWRGDSIGIREEILKEITAEVLGMTEFDAELFMERVDYISVSPDKMLTYHFKDGKNIVRKYVYARKKQYYSEERRAKASVRMREMNITRKAEKC